MPKKKTLEEFIIESNKVHDNLYEYDKTIYINAKEDVEIKCKIHGYFWQRATNHLQGRGCRKCGNTEYKTDEELLEIRNRHNLENKNYKILKIYRIEENGYDKIMCDCECLIDNYRWTIPITSINTTEFCPKCNNCVKDYTIFDIIEKIDILHPNIKILSDEYIGTNELLLCECTIHNRQFYKSFDALNNRKRPCPICHKEAFRGENNPFWNSSLTEEDRIKRRKLRCDKTGMDITVWRNTVYNKDNYTCAISGQIGGKLNAHHLDGWHWCKENRFNVNNGITLSDIIHKEFHSIYGVKYNTVAQFKEFYFNKTGKEFNIEEIKSEDIS